jgi:hypothetical protein
MSLTSAIEKMKAEKDSGSKQGASNERTHTGYMNLKVIGAKSRATMEVNEIVTNEVAKKLKMFHAKNSIFVEAVSGSKKRKDKADEVYQGTVDEVYSDILDYLEEETSKTVEDPECPSRFRLKVMLVECYSVEHHDEIFSMDDNDDDDELG